MPQDSEVSGLEALEVELISVDVERSTLLGRDLLQAQFLFTFTPDTEVRQTGAISWVRKMPGILQQGSLHTPLKPGRKVLIHWKADETNRRRMAVRITLR